MSLGIIKPNIREMSAEQRKIGNALLNDFLWKTGDYIYKTRELHLKPHNQAMFDRMKQAFTEYNEWLRK